MSEHQIEFKSGVDPVKLLITPGDCIVNGVICLPDGRIVNKLPIFEKGKWINPLVPEEALLRATAHSMLYRALYAVTKLKFVEIPEDLRESVMMGIFNEAYESTEYCSDCPLLNQCKTTAIERYGPQIINSQKHVKGS